MFKRFISTSRRTFGFSLIEVVFSIFIIATGLVVYASSLNLIRLVKVTRYQNVAYHIAEKKMEELRNTPFSSLPPTSTFSDPDLTLLPSGQGQINNGDFLVKVRRITVTVSWIEDGVSKNVRLVTLIYSGGINNL